MSDEPRYMVTEVNPDLPDTIRCWVLLTCDEAEAKARELLAGYAEEGLRERRVIGVLPTDLERPDGAESARAEAFLWPP